ncbi:hypothetical protein BC941DRAFT_358238 [Chlamydoabsidia padenii]|nr:hypothetical protein BC941DRAFT_358238 [Chlamydoabsidia padenii]
MSFFPTAQRPSHLVEFNAGKCIRENNTLKPDLRKGTIYMDQDLIIFPDEAEMVRVDECNTGRVYLLKFKSSNQKLFFWMQKKDDDMDEEWVNKVNRLINDPQSLIEEGRQQSDRGFPTDSQDLMQMLGENDIGMSQENLMQFLQAAGGFGSMDLDEQQQPVDEKRLSSTQIDSMKDIIADVMVTEEESPIELSDDVLSPGALYLLFQDDNLRSALFPDINLTTLPSQQDIHQLVHTAGFQTCLNKIAKALENDSLDPILTYLGLEATTSKYWKTIW